MRNVFRFLVAATLLAAAPLAAQENRAWPERSFVTIDVPFQPLNNDFSETVSVADTLRRTENVAVVADYQSTRGALVDIGGGVRYYVWRAVFVRPEVHYYHIVNNTNDFSNNDVIRVGASIGFTIGGPNESY